MTAEQVWFEVGKLVAQAVTALAVAWLAVRWALRRYKHEKVWEQQLMCFSDVIAAIADMRAVIKHWSSSIEESGDNTPEMEKLLASRYNTAKQKLGVSIARARLLLPAEARAILKELAEELDAAYRGDLARWFELELVALERGLDRVAPNGRSVLSILREDRGG